MAPRRLGARTLARVAETSTRRARWVLGGWVLLAVLGTLFVPRLESVVRTDATPFLPANSPSISAFATMDKAFAGGKGESIAFVVLTAPDFAENPTDQGYYRALVARLPAGASHVADMQDYVARPALKSSLTSKDGDSTYVPVS